MRNIWVLCLLFACSPGQGPDVTVCIVDVPNHGFQCQDAKNSSFILFEGGTDLLCASPQETELFLKACKSHKVLPVTLCSYQSSSQAEFLCTTPSGQKNLVEPAACDNFFCLSSKDRTRLTERCN